MIKNKEKHRVLKKAPLVCASLGLLTAAILALGCAPAFAEDDDIFQKDIGRWMSFGHYNEAKDRGILKTIDPPAAADPAEKPAANTPAVAAPKRPIDLPVMPGLNQGYDVRLDTTDDDTASNSPVIDPNAPPDIHPSDKNWQSPQEAVKYHKNADGSDSPALNVRMSYLPNLQIKPIPEKEKASMQRKGDVALEKLTKERNALKDGNDDAAIAAAIKSYKKQQLEALQSDQETLKALQGAVTKLGLQKQLGFVTGQNSNLPDSFPTNSVDLPVPDTTAK